MAAENKTLFIIQNRKGQSLLEVLFVIPILLLFVGLLFKVNMAVQMAINNTQYARSQVFVLTANSPNYPRLGFTYYNTTVFAGNEQDRLVMGVSDPSALSGNNNGKIDPIPQTQKIGRSVTTVKGSTDSGEVKLRNEIRVRNTSAICTQINAIGKGKPMTAKNIPELGAQYWPFKMSVCQYNGKAGS